MESELLLGVIAFALTLYGLTGGADFGGGVWEFNTAMTASDKERALIYRAIGPVWEANHVWIIFALVGLFTGFPVAFAGICRALWIPLLLALLGIVFRGVGFVFRSYATGDARAQQVWGTVFALASTAAPFFLGAAAGALASGQLPLDAEGRFTGNPTTGWLNPTSIYAGFFAVGVCAYLASVYLVREAAWIEDPELCALWRARALATGAWMGVLAAAGLAICATDSPVLWAGLRARATLVIGASLVYGFTSLHALWTRRHDRAVIGAIGAVTTVIWGCALAMYPCVVPPNLTIQATAAPANVMRAVLYSIGGGMLVLIPSLILLFALFKGKKPQETP